MERIKWRMCTSADRQPSPEPAAILVCSLTLQGAKGSGDVGALSQNVGQCNERTRKLRRSLRSGHVFTQVMSISLCRMHTRGSGTQPPCLRATGGPVREPPRQMQCREGESGRGCQGQEPPPGWRRPSSEPHTAAGGQPAAVGRVRTPTGGQPAR